MQAWDDFSSWVKAKYTAVTRDAKYYWDILVGARENIEAAYSKLKRFEKRIPADRMRGLVNDYSKLASNQNELESKFASEVRSKQSVGSGVHGLGVAPIIWAGVALTGVAVSGYLGYRVMEQAKEAYNYRQYVDTYTAAMERGAPLPKAPGEALSVAGAVGGLPLWAWALVGVGGYIVAKKQKWI